MEAGNTVETLTAVNVNDAAQVAAPVEVVETPIEVSVQDTVESEHVSRDEHNELRDAFLRLVERIEKFNLGAPHRI